MGFVSKKYSLIPIVLRCNEYIAYLSFNVSVQETPMLSDAESTKTEVSQPAKKKKRVSYCFEIGNLFLILEDGKFLRKCPLHASDHTVARFIWCWMTIC